MARSAPGAKSLISGVDHVAVIVRDLDRSLADFELLLGRSANWRGTLEGARHAWLQLANVAFDVISPSGEGRFGNLATERLATNGEGIWSIGLGVGNLDSARRTLERRGLDISEVTELHSRSDDGQGRCWRYANLSRTSTSGVPLFLVQSQSEPWPSSPLLGEEEAAVTGLDHIVVRTQNADRAAALYGARLGLDLRLDRSNENWGARLLFFRCGDLILEVAASLREEAGAHQDSLGGLALRIPDLSKAHVRLGAAGFDISELRRGRKPGTQVFTVRSRTANIPILMLESDRSAEA